MKRTKAQRGVSKKDQEEDYDDDDDGIIIVVEKYSGHSSRIWTNARNTIFMYVFLSFF